MARFFPSARSRWPSSLPRWPDATRVTQRTRDRLAPIAFLWKTKSAPGEANDPRRTEAFRLVRLYTSLSIPGGLVPIPFSDVVLVTGLQLRMLARISRVYGVPFSHDKGRLLVGALLLGLPQGLSNGLIAGAMAARSVSFLMIGPGSVLGGVTLSALGATVTFALGQVFIEHFETGGTLLDFDAAAAREMLALKVVSYNRDMLRFNWLRRRR
jgi:uncharacterized protein (DUF697 family)